MITQDDFANWLEHPVTKQLRKKLREDITNYQLMLITVDHGGLEKLQAHTEAALKLSEMEFEDLL